MPALAPLVRDHRPLLVLDTASLVAQAGLFPAEGPPRWASAEGAAGTGLFRCLEALGVVLAEVRGFAFCEGPGSILGVRTAAMALRVWTGVQARPVFAYSSLALLLRANPGAEAAIADARRGLWHRLGADGASARVPGPELSGRLVTPASFRHWAPLPAGAEPAAYELPALLAAAGDADLFRPCESPDAALAEEPRYAEWIPQPHRAP